MSLGQAMGRQAIAPETPGAGRSTIDKDGATVITLFPFEEGIPACGNHDKGYDREKGLSGGFVHG